MQFSMAVAAVKPNDSLRHCNLRARRKPFTSPVVCTAAPSSAANRRTLLLQFLSMPALLASAPALALIVDDSDEDLIKKLESRRKDKLAQEKAVERDFAREEGFVNKALEKELIPVQRAVRKLAQSGQALEQGDVKAAAAALSGAWLSELDTACKDLSAASASATAGLAPVLKNISDLQGAAAAGNLRAAKGSYISTVDALAAWVTAAGIQGSIKGI